jgi:chaperonin GroES
MSKVSIKPLADRVLVEPAEAETKTASGIIIPDTAKEKPQKGNVVAIGTGKKDEPLTVKVGDAVYFMVSIQALKSTWMGKTILS